VKKLSALALALVSLLWLTGATWLPLFVPAVVTYQGPGDVYSSGALGAYSCSEAYNAAYATSLGSACDVVDTATGLVTCTYHFQSNGMVNPTECNTTGKSCFTACRVAKAYNQVTPGTLDVVQATLASMPGLTFSSTPTGTLPAIDCTIGTNPLLATSATVTQAVPLSGFSVFIRSSGTSIGGALGGNTTIILPGSGAGANLALVLNGGSLTAAATDAAWHAVGGLTNGTGTSSAINVDGADTTGATGLGGFSSNNIRLCRAAADPQSGLIAEAVIWSTATSPTNRNSLNTNAHSAGRYNF
jgi:hypothetical protein